MAGPWPRPPSGSPTAAVRKDPASGKPAKEGPGTGPAVLGAPECSERQQELPGALSGRHESNVACDGRRRSWYLHRVLEEDPPAPSLR